jgi:DNA-binding response OmpR family regulator
MKNILIIEDDVELALSIKKFLEIIGFSVQIVTDGKKGLLYSARNKYDLLIIDFKLPEISGDEIIRKIRASGSEIPIIMLTGMKDTSLLNRVLGYGADDYIEKPFSTTELEARIRKLFKRTPVSFSDSVVVNDIQLDFSSGTITYGGTAMSLTKRETELIKFLYINRNRMVSREKLLNNVWSDKPYLNPNTVDCYIANIRRKLNKTDLIKTCHGFGYTISI